MDDPSGRSRNKKKSMRKFFGRKNNVTEEDVISMVHEGRENGVFLSSEARMIKNVFEFDEKDAKDIMIHRNNITALDGEITLRKAKEVFMDKTFSRIPVYVGDLDNIIGILHIREVLIFSSREDELEKKIRDIDGLLQKAESVPETRSINTLFTQMQIDKLHMVIVTDEYGQTSGLISMEDILEEIVGNIEDEHDKEQPDAVLVSGDGYTMDGMTALSEVSEKLLIDFGDTEIETLNGFLTDELGRIPEEHSTFDVEAKGYVFHVCGVRNGVIGKVRVKKIE